MKKPFILVDLENRELIVIIKSIAKVIPFDKIGKEQDFIDEIYRRFKSINMINQYTSIDRKAYIQLVEDLRVQHQSPLDLLKQEKNEELSNQTSKRSIQQANVPVGTELSSEEELANSTLVRSAIEKRIAVGDLDMKFNTPYDYCDLSMFDQEKVKQSTQLSFLLRKGILVKTTFEEIEVIKSKCMKEKRKTDEQKRNKQIVNRKEILGDDEGLVMSDEEGLVMSDEEVKSGISSESQEVASTVNVDLEGSKAARLVSDFFVSRTENILTEGMDGDMQRLVGSMKKE